MTGTRAAWQRGSARAGRDPRLPIWLLVILVLGVFYGVVRLRIEANVACDVGINGGLAALPALALGVVLAGVVIVAVLLARLVPSLVGSVLIVLVILYLSSFQFLRWTAPPEGYPSPVTSCVDNVPDWWPAGLPA